MIIREHKGHKYRIYTTDNDKTVIAVSSFAGRTVKAIAKCNPDDSPNIETGIMLAILRCDEKICVKKVKHAADKYNRVNNEVLHAQKRLEKANEYMDDAFDEHRKAAGDLKAFECLLDPDKINN